MSEKPYGPEWIDRTFAYHPATEATGPLHDQVRQGCRDLAHAFDGLLPDGPDKTLALRRLQEAMWAANACIAVNGPR